MSTTTEIDKTSTQATEPAPRPEVRIGSDIVAASVPDLRRQLREATASGITNLVLDLADVRMVDSTGIGLLISAHNSLRRSGGALELINVDDEIGGLFRSMRMHRHFRISGKVQGLDEPVCA